MNEDVSQSFCKLSITDQSEQHNPGPVELPAQEHAVAGLELAVASLRELIGKWQSQEFSAAELVATQHRNRAVRAVSGHGNMAINLLSV